jgi:CLIP-associating protein 1/2
MFNLKDTSGAVDANSFQEAFENVPKVQIFEKRDLLQLIAQVNTCLSDENNDWEKRVDSVSILFKFINHFELFIFAYFFYKLKRLRAIALFCKTNSQFIEDFFQSIKNLNVCVSSQVKDLRSLTVREACITVAYLAQILQNRFESFAEIILPDLINLIQSSAKVMSTSGMVACQFIIENTHGPRLLAIILNSINSRSKEIRRCSCEFLNQLLQVWETDCLLKHQTLIAQAIKKGISDADQDARSYSRKAFWSYHAHFSTQAQKLLESLEPKYQKLLQSGANDRYGSVRSVNNEHTDTQK